jgi:hypothetical protein
MPMRKRLVRTVWTGVRPQQEDGLWGHYDRVHEVDRGHFRSDAADFATLNWPTVRF